MRERNLEEGLPAVGILDLGGGQSLLDPSAKCKTWRKGWRTKPHVGGNKRGLHIGDGTNILHALDYPGAQDLAVCHHRAVYGGAARLLQSRQSLLGCLVTNTVNL